MSDKEKSGAPSADRRFWLYDPEGDGMTYYRTREARDADAAEAIKGYNLINEGWMEEVEFVAAGELTHFAQCLDKKHRPETLDEEGLDEDGTWWDADWEWMGNYAMEPLLPNAGNNLRSPQGERQVD